jgi:hypothetical protein
MDDRRTVAYHEAGHAVAAYRLRGTLLYVNVRRESGRLGACAGYFEDHYLGRDAEGRLIASAAPYKADAVQAYAGRAAEGVLSGETSPFVLHGGEEDDYRKAARAIARFGGDVQRLSVRYTRVALWLVRRYWSDVDSVARALLDHDELLDDEVGILIEQGRDSMEEFRRTFRRPR